MEANKMDQSFETLEDVLKQLKPECGIDVEIKYPSQYKVDVLKQKI